MKLFLSFLLLTATLLGVWYLSRTIASPSVPSGQVEKQIHGLGTQLDAALEPSATFDKNANGYQPKPKPPQAPAGLKPQEAQAWTAFALGHEGRPALVPTFPEHYSDATQVRAQGMTVSLTPLKANAATAQVENGKLVYHNAYTSTDSMNVVSEGRSEEFLLLHDAQAPQRFDYDLSTVSGVKTITLADNAVTFTGTDGKTVQIEQPWLVETGGRKVANAVHWELSYPNGDTHPHLALVVSNPQQLHYPVVIDPTWVVTNGSMSTGREYHTATLLTSGLVLVAGGESSTAVLGTAELFNPATGTWTATGSLATARFKHTATLLQNGKVLVTGGLNTSGTVLTSCELFDPAANSGAGTWSATGALHTARNFHTATLLNNGQVLVAGGVGVNATYVNVSELFNPAGNSGAGSWTTSGNMVTGRELHTATLLPSGKVLVAGGYNGNALSAAEIFDPTGNSGAGTWAATVSMTTARWIHSATLLNNGMVLVAGGLNTAGNTLNTSELFNPAGNSGGGTWSATSGSLATARYSHSSTLLPSGQVLVVGGNGSSGAPLNTAEIFTYNPSGGGGWVVTTNNLTTACQSQTATLLPGGLVLVAGGVGPSTTFLASSELYNPANGTWAVAASPASDGYSHTATLLPKGQVLVTGGYDGNFNPLSTAELYANGTWTPTGSLHTARAIHSATLLPNGQVLVAGGLGSDSVLASAELYNPGNGMWTPTGSLNTARSYLIATLLPDGQVLVFGGVGGSSGSPLASAELYNPSTQMWTPTGSLKTARLFPTATLLPNGQVLVAGGTDKSQNGLFSTELYNPTSGTWTLAGNLHTARNSHTATLLPDGLVLVAGGLQGAYDNITPSAELFNPTTNTWAATGSLTDPRYNDTATLLLNGQVLVEGGSGASGNLTTAELYNPASGLWTATGSLHGAQVSATGTLLSNGQVLVSGGGSDIELFSPGLGYTPSTQPLITSASAPGSTAPVTVTGSGFRSPSATFSEGSGGTTSGSASNIPVVVLQSLVNEQVQTLTLNESTGFTATSFTSLAPSNFVPGYALLTVFVNGTPSASQIVSYSELSQTISGLPSMQTLSADSSPITLPSITSDGQAITYIVVSGPATVSDDTLTFTGSGTVILMANSPGNGIYAPLATYDIITVTTPPAVATDTPTMPQWALVALASLLMATAWRSAPAWRSR